MSVGLRFGIGPLRVYIPISGGRRRRRRRGRQRRPSAPYWYHGTCTIHHRTLDAANRCTNRATTVRETAPIAAPKPTVSWRKVVGIGTIATALLIGGAVYNANRPHTKTVTRSRFVGTWPLTVEAGTLTCPHGIVLFTAGGVTYAEDPLPGDGHVNIDAITADELGVPGLKMQVYSFLAEGETLC
ncbi:hypothetical protein [Catenulispora pinisilvae]|uniref:hypothetical protein n=1 Tax=Catenulispora pinisilvae TaxID=2705253 RepID=UPI0018915BAF|nr:hypothetical protein [Catenulispora pinisilvae]